MYPNIIRITAENNAAMENLLREIIETLKALRKQRDRYAEAYQQSISIINQYEEMTRELLDEKRRLQQLICDAGYITYGQFFTPMDKTK